MDNGNHVMINVYFQFYIYCNILKHLTFVQKLADCVSDFFTYFHTQFLYYILLQ